MLRKRGKKDTKVTIPSGFDADAEEELIKNAASIVVDKQVKSDLSYGMTISSQITRVLYWIEGATVNPTLRNFYALYRSIRALDALIVAYTTTTYKDKREAHVEAINKLEFEGDKQDREQAVDECISWFSDITEDLHRVGMLFKESIGAIM